RSKRLFPAHAAKSAISNQQSAISKTPGFVLLPFYFFLVQMLTLLNISNVALIDEQRVEFEEGLNLLTGETGSGKSIIVDALGVLIGGRFTSDLLKSGSDRAFIEGLFSVVPGRELQSLFASSGIEITNSRDPGNNADRNEPHEIIIRRELSASGR